MDTAASKKIPIDIVLLPPDDIFDLCIELSRRAYERGENVFLRNKIDRLPHASMLMGCSREHEIEAVAAALEQVAKRTTSLQLSIINQVTEPSGMLEIAKTPELVTLQDDLVATVNPLLHQDCEVADLVEDPSYQFTEESRVHTNNYARDNRGDGFFPHITTHNRQIEDIRLPIDFTASTLALCPMGDHGTCRKPFAVFPLAG